MTEPLLVDGDCVGPVKRGIRTLEIAAYATVDSWLGGSPGWGQGREVMTTLRAAFGTEVSMVWDAVKLESLSMRGDKVSAGNRRTSGPKLEECMVRKEAPVDG